MEEKKKKTKKLRPLHDADLEVGGKWLKSSRGKGTESCHLSKKSKNPMSKGGAGKSFEPFGLLLRLSMPFIEKALQGTRSDWSVPARRPANLTDKYCTHVI